MTVFYLTLILVYIFSLLARIVRKKNKKYGIFFLIIVISILVLVAGLRNDIGDTGMYKHLYTLVGPGYSAGEGYEPGFIFFLKVLKVFSDNPQFMIFVTALITNVINISVIYSFTRDDYFELATFMYIASGYYIVTMNGIRQSLAAAFILLATYLILKGHFWRYCFVILILYTIHNSALIMIPVYFVVRQKAWTKNTYIIYGVTLIGLFMYQPFMNILMKVLGDSKYSVYSDFDGGGANPIRIAIFFVPVILAYMKRDSLKRRWDNQSIFVNMNIICLIVMLFSAFNWIFARFTIYFQLYSFILLPIIISKCLESKEKRLIYFLLIICYFIFFYYDHVITMNIVYTTDYNLREFLY